MRVDHLHLDDLAPASILVSAGRQPRVPGAGVNAPLELSSTYVADGPVNYARGGNPTWTAFEDALGALEGGAALVFASGMAAIAAALSLAPEGGVVVAPTHAYNGTGVILQDLAAAGRMTVRRVDISDTAAVTAALQGADLLWAESPTNPMLEVADLPTLIAAAHEQGATVTADTDAGRAAYERLSHHRLIHGAIAGPMETWLALRGMRTMHLRVERASANAADLAGRLAGHPCVQRVRYPGLGAIVAIEVPGGAEGAERVASATRLWTHATSLGGVESLIERRRRHASEPLTVPENLLRLSVGVEDVDDLWRDLASALSTLGGDGTARG